MTASSAHALLPRFPIVKAGQSGNAAADDVGVCLRDVDVVGDSELKSVWVKAALLFDPCARVSTAHEQVLSAGHADGARYRVRAHWRIVYEAG